VMITAERGWVRRWRGGGRTGEGGGMWVYWRAVGGGWWGERVGCGGGGRVGGGGAGAGGGGGREKGWEIEMCSFPASETTTIYTTHLIYYVRVSRDNTIIPV